MTRLEGEMIELLLGIHWFAWWGVFWLLIPGDSPLRLWAFLPAAICALGIPILVWDHVSNSILGTVLWFASWLLPFGIMAGLLVRCRRKRKTK
jgi:hypothetical protein